MTATADLFRALGDPERLRIIEQLSTDAPCPIQSLLGRAEISRQGVRKHLQVLADTGIVDLRPQGRQVYVHLNRESLQPGSEFLAAVGARWDQRLDALKRFVESEPD